MNRRRTLDGLADDIRDHIERETRENVERGMTPDEARNAALRKFGNMTLVMEETQDVWRRVWLEQLLQDVRYGFRFLRRNPRFTSVVVLTLALGIGITTAVFSVVNTVLLKPLSYPNPERLFWVGYYDLNIKRDMISLADFFGLRAHARSFDGMAAYGYQPAAITTEQSATQVTALNVGGDFWRITGAQARLGRLFGVDDRDCLVLSWDMFERDFQADPQVIGKLVLLNGRQVQVTGVLPDNFRFQFPMWWVADRPEPVAAYIALPLSAGRSGQSAQAVAALKAGISIEQARAELESLVRHSPSEEGRNRSMGELRAERIQEKLTSSTRRPLLVLFVAGAFVLLISCVNIANLLLARVKVRQKEVAIRAAVGAGRLRVIRQLLVESILQALAAGIAGLLLARWAIGVLARISPYALPRLSETAIDTRVLAFTLGVSILTGIMFGLGPAISLWQTNLHGALKDGARNSPGISGRRTRRLLVASELSLALVLVTAAGLMLKSFARMYERPPGLVPENVAVMKVRFAGSQSRTKEAQQTYLRQLVWRIEETPGVQSSGISTWFLFGGAPAFPADRDRSQTRVIRGNAVTSGYLKALGMSFVRGRWLADNDAGAALLNESMAREAFGDLDPIGRQLLMPEPVTIVGIIADVKYTKLDAKAILEIFIGYQQAPFLWGAEIAARGAGPAAPLVPVLQQRISEIDRSHPVYAAKTLETALHESIAPRRFNLFLLASFAVSALVLALIGIYGVISYFVAERTREIGVRMALGAQRGKVAVMVVREVLPATISGIIIGLGAAWALMRLMTTLLYDVNAADPQIFAAVAIVLGIAALGACVAPALKAASVDPIVALRYE